MNPNDRQPPMTETLATAEAATRRLPLPGPRVTLDEIRRRIVRIAWLDPSGGEVENFRALPQPEADAIARDLAVLTVCLVTLDNGFTVIGHAAPAAPENYNRDHGRRLAYEKCVAQLWPLLGCELRTRIREGW